MCSCGVRESVAAAQRTTVQPFAVYSRHQNTGFSVGWNPFGRISSSLAILPHFMIPLSTHLRVNGSRSIGPRCGMYYIDSVGPAV